MDFGEQHFTHGLQVGSRRGVQLEKSSNGRQIHKESRDCIARKNQKHRGSQVNTRHVSILLLVLVLAGCASNLENISQERWEANIGYLDGKFKVCREDCPTPTPKKIDDSIPLEVLVSEMVKKSKSAPVPALPPEPVQETKKAPEEIAEQQYEIHFDFGMSHPNAEGDSELRKFEEGIRGLNNRSIELIGRTDDIGTSKFNRRLARKRALNIATWIKARGIKAQIALSTKAECCRAAPYNKREPAFKEKRRVTIISRQIREGQMNK